MIIDLREMVTQPRRGVMVFWDEHIIPSGFGLLYAIFYNPAISSGLVTA